MLDRRFVIYDPERIGIALQRLTPKRWRPEAFQNLGLWRTWTAKSIKLRVKVRPSKVVIVPMTLIANASRRRLIGTARARWPDGVFEVWLRVPHHVLRERLVARDGKAAGWALRQLRACQAFEDSLPDELAAIDGEMLPSQIAREVQAVAIKC
jgi:ribose 1,5-bisphosphokinase PhnN